MERCIQITMTLTRVEGTMGYSLKIAMKIDFRCFQKSRGLNDF